MAGGAAFAVWLAARGTFAEPAPGRLVVQLDYDRDDALSGCLDEVEFERLVRAQVGYDPFSAEARYRVRATTRLTPAGIAGSLQWRGADGKPRGERHLQSDVLDCAAFGKRLVFALVVQLDLFNEAPRQLDADSANPEAKATPPTGTSSPATEATLTAPTATAPSITSERTSVASDADLDDARTTTSQTSNLPWRATVGAGVGLGQGLLSKPTALGRAFVGVENPRWAFEVGAEATPSVEPSGGPGIEEQLVQGALAGCLRFAPLSGCLVGKLGAYRAIGSGVDVVREPVGIAGRAGPRLALSTEWADGWVASVHADALASWIPWTVELDHSQVWQTPWLAFVVGLDLRAAFVTIADGSRQSP